MKIINCPKGGRVPENYCIQSCLNYPGKVKGKRTSLLKFMDARRELRNLFIRKIKAWILAYEEKNCKEKRNIC